MKIQFPVVLAFLRLPMRYKVLWGGRGGVKSWGIARQLLLDGYNAPLRILCARETMKSLKDSVYKLLCDQITLLGLQAEYEIQAGVILGRNVCEHCGRRAPGEHMAGCKDAAGNPLEGGIARTEFTFAGLKHNIDNIKSLESYDRVWIEEAQSCSKDSWQTLIPTIRKKGSEIWVSFNPKFKTDDTYVRFIVNPPPNAIVVKTSWRDNPWFTEELEIERLHLLESDLEAYMHVYEGECMSTVEGAIYGNEITAAEREHRLVSLPYDRTLPVDTVWDLGFGDKMAIWFVQVYGGWFNFIDYIEDNGRTIEWYVLQLRKRDYIYGTHWLPHDGVDAQLHSKLTSSKTMSPEQLMRKLGLKVRLAAKQAVHIRINAGRTLFPQCRFNTDKCDDGIRALRMYQWGPPTEDKWGNKIAKREPIHNEASHGADAYQVAAVALKQPKREEEKKPQGPPPAPPRLPGPYTPFG